MKSWKRLLYLFLFYFAPVQAQITSPAPNELSLDQKEGQSITLDQAVQIAIAGATQVLKAENESHYNGARLLQAYGQFLPSVYGSGTYGYNTGRTYSTVATPVFIDGAGRNANYSVSADLNIFNGMGDFSNLKSSVLRKDASMLTVKRAKQEISLDVAQTFLQVSLDDRLVEIAEKNLQASRERERLLQEQTDVGARNLSDLFRQQAETSLNESALLSAKNRTRTDQINLLRKLRLDLEKQYHFVTPTLVETETEPKIKSEEQMIALAIEKRLDLKASDETASANHWEVHTAQSNYFPKLDLIGNISSVGHTLDHQDVNGINVVPPNQTTLGAQLGRQVEYSIGLNLTWSLFDRFVTAENVSRAQANADNADIDALNRRLQVQGEVRQTYGDFRTAVQQLKSSKKGIDSAQKAYEVMDGRYSVGAASFLDLITAQGILVQAQSNRAQAVINFELQTRALSVAEGTTPVPEI